MTRPRRGRQQNRLRRRDPPSPSPVRASALGRRSPRCLGGGRGGIRRKLRPRVGGCFGKRRWDHEHTQSGQARGKDFESSHRFLLAQLARLPLGICSHDVVREDGTIVLLGRPCVNPCQACRRHPTGGLRPGAFPASGRSPGTWGGCGPRSVRGASSGISGIGEGMPVRRGVGSRSRPPAASR